MGEYGKHIFFKHFFGPMRLVYATITVFLLLMTSAQCQQTAEDGFNKGVALTDQGKYVETIQAYNVINLSDAESLKLNDGYELAIKSVDIDGNKVYVELFKDGQIVDSKVIIAANDVDETFNYSKPGTSQRIMVHFKNAFRGANHNLVSVDNVIQTSEITPSRILINDSTPLTITQGTSLKLEEGYELAIKSVDIDGNKVYVELFKDGQIVDSKVIIAANDVDDSFVYPKPGTTQKITVHFKNAFRSAYQTLATIDNISQ